MKTIAVLLVFVALAYAENAFYSPEFIDKLAAERLDCAKSEGVDPKHILRLDNIEVFPTFEEVKCHSMCMLNKFKLLNDDHTIKLESVKPIYKGDIFKKLIVILDTCLPEDKKLDTCEKVYNSHVCVYKNL